ncbi:hypothetical protein SYK_04250 [Pseudodesulfovibrio nedwellii]|uniref:Glutaredoxin domain-containing protein n=1 Tax=Pseudodesulfovibrio nedwellii TaxID=2973072 RepID=A0ABN6S150_9BACT|nr:hypothetical protein SYK_04250 [Pseudodesulfovibrio nedwellii]
MFRFIKDFFKGMFDVEPKETPTPKINETENTFDTEAFHMNDIKIYALSTCIHCRNAKKYLDECGVKYECVHVDELSGDDRKQIVQEIKSHNPAVSFPTIVIKDTVVVGYHKDKIDAALKGK